MAIQQINRSSSLQLTPVQTPVVKKQDRTTSTALISLPLKKDSSRSLSEIQWRILEARCLLSQARQDFTRLLIDMGVNDPEEELHRLDEEIEKYAKQRELNLDRLDMFATAQSFITVTTLVTGIAVGASTATPLGLAYAAYCTLSFANHMLQGTGILNSLRTDPEKGSALEKTMAKVTTAADWTVPTAISFVSYAPWIGTGAKKIIGEGRLLDFARRWGTPLVTKIAPLANRVQPFSEQLSKNSMMSLTGIRIIGDVLRAGIDVTVAWVNDANRVIEADLTELNGKVSNLNLGVETSFEKLKTIQAMEANIFENAMMLLRSQNDLHEALNRI